MALLVQDPHLGLAVRLTHGGKFVFALLVHVLGF
jgi:hypothetical protein